MPLLALEEPKKEEEYEKGGRHDSSCLFL